MKALTKANSRCPFRVKVSLFGDSKHRFPRLALKNLTPPLNACAATFHSPPLLFFHTSFSLLTHSRRTRFQVGEERFEVTSLRGMTMQQKGRGYEMEKFYFHPPGHSYPGNSRWKRIHYSPAVRRYLGEICIRHECVQMSEIRV